MDFPPSFVPHPESPTKRNVKKVPYVELYGGRVQGVVSSGSDIKRVYVAFLATGSGDFYCSTNNNRPCGGLRGGPCKHIMELLKEAVVQFGPEQVNDYLQARIENPKDMEPYNFHRQLNGNQVKENAGVVFSRFLNYLRFCELKTAPGELHEMNWFG